LRVQTLDGHQIHIFEARVLPSYINLIINIFKGWYNKKPVKISPQRDIYKLKKVAIAYLQIKKRRNFKEFEEEIDGVREGAPSS
jgi:hypothetical protein